MDRDRFSLTLQQTCDPRIYKDDSTTKEKIFFYILLALNLLLLADACHNMVVLCRRYNIRRISKLIMMNFAMTATILFRLAYQFDAVFENYLSIPSYVFFGVGSVVLLDSVMLACAFYWYNAIILIRASLGDLSGQISKIHWGYRLLMFLNLLGLSIVFWIKIIQQDCFMSASLTAITSMVDGIIFTTSSILLWRFIRDIPKIDPTLKQNVKRGVYVGYCSIYRFIVDLSLLFPFSQNFKDNSENANNLAWPIFFFVYLFIGDIIPSILLLRVFVIKTRSSSRADSEIEIQEGSTINQEIFDQRDIKESSHPLTNTSTFVEKFDRAGTILNSCPNLLKGTQSFRGEQLKNFQVVVVFFSASWTSMSAEVVSKVKSVYEEVNNSQNALEVVFVSCDSHVQLFKEFYETMPWAAVPFEEKKTREQLLEIYSDRSLPELVVLKKNGGVAARNGRSDIEKYGAKAFYKWITVVDELLKD